MNTINQTQYAGNNNANGGNIFDTATNILTTISTIPSTEGKAAFIASELCKFAPKTIQWGRAACESAKQYVSVLPSINKFCAEAKKIDVNVLKSSTIAVYNCATEALGSEAKAAIGEAYQNCANLVTTVVNNAKPTIGAAVELAKAHPTAAIVTGVALSAIALTRLGFLEVKNWKQQREIQTLKQQLQDEQSKAKGSEGVAQNHKKSASKAAKR